MIITINTKYRIVSDPLQWQLQYRAAEKTDSGKEANWRGLGYHRTLNHAVCSLTQRAVREIDGEFGLEDLAALADKIDGVVDEIRFATIGK